MVHASTYTSDGKQCTLQQIQRILRDISVDPEGSNVVMQGDVTRIVSMNNKERRNPVSYTHLTLPTKRIV